MIDEIEKQLINDVLWIAVDLTKKHLKTLDSFVLRNIVLVRWDEKVL